MSEQKPLKLNTATGDIERFKRSEEIPGSPVERICELERIVWMLILELQANNWPIQSPELIEYFQNKKIS